MLCRLVRQVRQSSAQCGSIPIGHQWFISDSVSPIIVCWLVVGPPLWKIWKSVGMIRNPRYGKMFKMATKPPTSLLLNVASSSPYSCDVEAHGTSLSIFCPHWADSSGHQSQWSECLQIPWPVAAVLLAMALQMLSFHSAWTKPTHLWLLESGPLLSKVHLSPFGIGPQSSTAMLENVWWGWYLPQSHLGQDRGWFPAHTTLCVLYKMPLPMSLQFRGNSKTTTHRWWFLLLCLLPATKFSRQAWKSAMGTWYQNDGKSGFRSTVCGVQVGPTNGEIPETAIL